MLQATRRPSDGKAVLQKCDARDCPDCGPGKREQNLAHDLENLLKSGRPVIKRRISEADRATGEVSPTWNRLRAKIKRAADAEGIDGGWVAYPQHDAKVLVFAVVGMTGTLVTELTDELADAYEGLPAGAKIRRPRCWALNPQASGAGGGEKAYRVLGSSTVTQHTPAILRRLGLYREQVDEAAVPLNAWEVHNFTIPPLESQAYRLLVQAFDLEEGKAKPSKRRRPVLKKAASQ